MSEFKGTSVYEKSNEYAKSKCSEEIGSKFIPETDLTIYDACELDFRNGYNQALEDSKAKEMLDILIDLRECKETWSDLFQSDKDRIEQLIKQATEI